VLSDAFLLNINRCVGIIKTNIYLLIIAKIRGETEVFIKAFQNFPCFTFNYDNDSYSLKYQQYGT